jgi:hypothetical protein
MGQSTYRVRSHHGVQLECRKLTLQPHLFMKFEVLLLKLSLERQMSPHFEKTIPLFVTSSHCQMPKQVFQETMGNLFHFGEKN